MRVVTTGGEEGLQGRKQAHILCLSCSTLPRPTSASPTGVTSALVLCSPPTSPSIADPDLCSFLGRGASADLSPGPSDSRSTCLTRGMDSLLEWTATTSSPRTSQAITFCSALSTLDHHQHSTSLPPCSTTRWGVSSELVHNNLQCSGRYHLRPLPSPSSTILYFMISFGVPHT